jgi:hypothetical protein
MAINRIQFQHGMSLLEFNSRYGTESQCSEALFALRWPTGFACPQCGSGSHYRLLRDDRVLLQCRACRRQTSLTAGTLMDSSKLPLRVWFLAIYLVSQAKTGLASLALKRQLGVDYRTAWLMHHKLMSAMADVDAKEPLEGDIQLDDAYLGGERPGTPGRGSPNKVPIVAAVALDERQHPRRVKLSPIAGFTTEAISTWAKQNLAPGCDVRSDGLACFAGVIDAGCAHSYVVVGDRKPRDLPQFTWVNTVLGNLKNMIDGAYKAFDFRKYAQRYLGTFAYRFNRRHDLAAIVSGLVRHAANATPFPERALRRVAEVSH